MMYPRGHIVILLVAAFKTLDLLHQYKLQEKSVDIVIQFILITNGSSFYACVCCLLFSACCLLSGIMVFLKESHAAYIFIWM